MVAAERTWAYPPAGWDHRVRVRTDGVAYCRVERSRHAVIGLNNRRPPGIRQAPATLGCVGSE
jgi:hypothetical protein